MRIVYNIVFTLIFWIGEIWHLVKMWRRGNWRAGYGQRYARYEPELKASLAQRPVIWLHAVSVGEVGVCLQLLGALSARLPQARMIVSTTTSTGMGELRRRLPPNVPAIYYPLDLAMVVRRALETLRPSAIILVEAELWPNLLWQSGDRGIPLFLVNARVSERSFRRYLRFGFVFRPLFGLFRGVGSQNVGDAERLAAIGFPRGAIKVTGNLKFDAAQPSNRAGLDAAALLRQIGVNNNSLVFVAGSTHAGEEALLAAMLPRLRARCPNLFLVLVPRHAERAREVARELEALQTKFILRTDITPETRLAPGQADCLLVNSTGELIFFYQQAAVVFVGKSLTAEGGQNPIEPAALGKAMAFGPNMQNFASVARALVEGQGAAQVDSAAELEETLAQLLADEARRARLGAQARRVFQENLGATDRTVEMLLQAWPTLPPLSNEAGQQ